MQYRKYTYVTKENCYFAVIFYNAFFIRSRTGNGSQSRCRTEPAKSGKDQSAENIHHVTDEESLDNDGKMETADREGFRQEDHRLSGTDRGQ